MTRDELIELAKEVGMCGMLTDVVTTIDELERFAALVAAVADKRIAELESSWVACHAQLAESCDARYKLERKLDVAREELLRCKRIMLRECGIGVVDENVLAQIGGEDAR